MATFFGGGLGGRGRGRGGIGFGFGYNRDGDGLTPWMEKAVTEALWEAWNNCGDDDAMSEDEEEDDDAHDDLAAVSAAATNATATARSARGRRAGGSSSSSQRVGRRQSPTASGSADDDDDDDEANIAPPARRSSSTAKGTAATRGGNNNNNKGGGKKPSPSPPGRKKRSSPANKAKLAQVVGVRLDLCTVDLSDGHVIVTCVVDVPQEGEYVRGGGGSAAAAAYAKKLQGISFLLRSLQRGVLVKLVDWSVARIVNDNDQNDNDNVDNADASSFGQKVRLGLQADEVQIRVVGGYGSPLGGNPVPIAESVEYRRHVQTLVASSHGRFRRAMMPDYMAHVTPQPLPPKDKPAPPPPPPPLPPPPLPPVVQQQEEEEQQQQQNAQPQQEERGGDAAVNAVNAAAAATAATAAASEPIRGEDGVPVGDVAALLGWSESRAERGTTNDNNARAKDGPNTNSSSNNKEGVEELAFGPVEMGFAVSGTNRDEARTVRSWRQASELFRQVLEHDRNHTGAHSLSTASNNDTSSSSPRRIEAPTNAGAPPLPTFRPLPEEEDFAERPETAAPEAAACAKDAGGASQALGDLDDDDDGEELRDETQPAASALGLKGMLLEEEGSDDDDNGSQGGDNEKEENEEDRTHVQARGSPKRGKKSSSSSDGDNGHGRNEAHAQPVSTVDDAIELLLQADGGDTIHSARDEAGAERAKDRDEDSGGEDGSGAREPGPKQTDDESSSEDEATGEPTATAGAAESATESDDSDDGDHEAGDEHGSDYDESQKPMLLDHREETQQPSPSAREEEIQAGSRMRTRRNTLRDVVLPRSSTRAATQPAAARRSSRNRVVPRTFTQDFLDAVVTRRKRPESAASGSRDASVASRDNTNRRGKGVGDGETSVLTTHRTNHSRPSQAAKLPPGGSAGAIRTAREVPRTASPPLGKKRAHSQPDAKDGDEHEVMDVFVSKFRKINGLFDKWMGWASMKPDNDAPAQHGSFDKATAGRSRMPGNEILQWLNERGMLSE